MESIKLDNIPDECYEEVKKIKTQMEEQFHCKRIKIENQYLKIITQANNSPRDVIRCWTPSKIHWFFSFYIEFFKSLLDKQVNIGQTSKHWTNK